MTSSSTFHALADRVVLCTVRAQKRAVALALASAALAGAGVSPAAMAAQPGGVLAAAPSTASAGAAVSGMQAGSAATTVTVKPGQSLNDIAIAITQSHDRAVLSRASKAIFDANPAAFTKDNESLLKLGAVLNVPPLDATGAPVAAAASSPAATPTVASSASDGKAASAPVATAGASQAGAVG
jgi:pilus assembly protein FimV